MEKFTMVENVRCHLKEIRMARGISREELEMISGVSLYTIASAEQNARLPRADTLCALAGSLGCTLDELLTFDVVEVE